VYGGAGPALICSREGTKKDYLALLFYQFWGGTLNREVHLCHCGTATGLTDPIFVFLTDARYFFAGRRLAPIQFDWQQGSQPLLHARPHADVLLLKRASGLCLQRRLSRPRAVEQKARGRTNRLLLARRGVKQRYGAVVMEGLPADRS
jgi:hypothetical protein